MSALDAFKRNTEHLISADQLRERLESGKPLRVKLGVDPTRPDLTFGHLVVFNKLRQFQDLGHQAVLIIGDFTAMIGDPSGRSSTRPVLSADEVAANATTYLDQAFKVLDRDRTEVRYNSEWFGKMSFADSLALARKMTVARMLERDDFAQRYAQNSPISIVEFLYPLIQGHDSVMIQSDVEMGGSDQLFNMLVGRALQKEAGQLEQIVIAMPLLVGLDGVKKMSKSADNYIAFNDPPKEMFGKIMSISDEVMWDYYRLLLELDDEAVARHRAGHPLAAKKHLAASLVGMFHSLDAGRHELEQFEKVFSRHEQPDEMPVFSWNELFKTANPIAAAATDGQGNPLVTELKLVDLLGATNLFPSKNDVRRLIEQGAVKLGDEKIGDPKRLFSRPEKEYIFQAGKRTFFKILP
jgi:tyrosyl-tRNA synthetase